MNSQVKNNEFQHVSVELTAEEALALTGVRFNGNPEVKAIARKKFAMLSKRHLIFHTKIR